MENAIIAAMQDTELKPESSEEPETASLPPTAGPSFVDVNSEVRQRLGLKKIVASSPSSTGNVRALRVRSRSSEEYDRGSIKCLSRSKALSEVWFSDTCTDSPPLRRKLRPLSTAGAPIGLSSTKRAAGINWSSIIRTSITAILLTVMTFAAALAIHKLLLNTGNGDSMLMKPWTPSDDGDEFCDPIEQGQLDIDSLSVALRTEVFGQDLAVETLLARLEDHFSWNRSGEVSVDDAAIEPTVLVLHGGTGTGKTHTARILSDHFTRAGLKVHWYFSTFDRPNKHLLSWVAAKWSTAPPCSSSSLSVVFVLDDFDVLLQADQLEATLAYWKTKIDDDGDCSSTARPIFLITFSKDAEFLETELLEHVMNDGSREDFATDVMQWQCPFGDHQVTYVPFLPIQSEQLEACVRQALGLNSSSDEESDNILAAVIDNTNFVPEEYPLFSKYGCKRLQTV